MVKRPFFSPLKAVGQGLGWPQMIKRATPAALDFNSVGDGVLSSPKQKGAATATSIILPSIILHCALLKTQSHISRPRGHGCDGCPFALSGGIDVNLIPVFWGVSPPQDTRLSVGRCVRPMPVIAKIERQLLAVFEQAGGAIKPILAVGHDSGKGNHGLGIHRH